MTPVINLINLLDSTFTTSFRHTSSVLYSVTFETSNLTETYNKLIELEKNYTNGINTGKHVGLLITLSDITNVKHSFNSLVQAYLELHGINAVPSRLKLNDMLKELRVNEEKKDVINMSEKVVKNILAPNPPERKLTYKQKIKEAALKKSEERKLEMIKKLGK